MGSKYWDRRLKYREAKDTVLFFRLLTLWWEKKNKYNPINSGETSRGLTDNGNDADSDAEVIITQKSK